MRIEILSSLFLLTILHSLLALKIKVKQVVSTCNYSYLDNQIKTDPTQDNIRFLGNAAPFGVLAGSGTTNSGKTTVVRSLGVYPSASITGDTITLIGGTFHAADSPALIAENDLTIAYNYLSLLPTNTDLTGNDLTGLTLLPGVYRFSSSAFLSGGILTLDAKLRCLCSMGI